MYCCNRNKQTHAGNSATRFAATILSLSLSLFASTAQAEVVFGGPPLQLTLEGFVNATVGTNLQANSPLLGDVRHSQIDTGLRFYTEYKLAAQRVLGARFELNASTQQGTSFGERSLIYIDPLGRFEVGRRRGLPDNLIGYAPNTYAFTSAEFGVNSGRTLDPGGTLTTRFLPPALASRIDAVSENGANSAFFNDASPKVLYVSPKVLGTQLGLSYTPQLDNTPTSDNPYQQLLQTGLAYQQDFGQHFFRFGGSLSVAALDRTTAPSSTPRPGRNLASLSLGGGLNLGEVWDFGLNLTQNSKDNLTPGRFLRYGAKGITASINYNEGQWVYGAYLQRAYGGETLVGRDDLQVLQLGVAYRFDAQFRVFAAYYRYALHNALAANSTGTVLLAGVRWIL